MKAAAIPAAGASLRGLHIHFEPTSGIAGDMAVAALVDLGVPAAVVAGAVRAMGVAGLEVAFGHRRRGAYVGRSFEVSWPGRRKGTAVHAGHPHEHEHDHPHAHGHIVEPPRAGAARRGRLHAREDDGHGHRDYREIRRLLAGAALEPETRKLAGRIFARLAEVEADLHGTTVDRVTFHEVGAYDSIADVVGVAAALGYLQPASVGSAPPVVGTGRVRTDHGPVPVPAPATAALLKGVPVLPEGEGELTTPTGAAILAVVAEDFGAPPPMRMRAIGYGTGTRELADRANVLRVIAGERLGAADRPAAPQVMLVEANLDDMSPQLMAPLCEALLEAGAVDVWTTPILMKKGRPAFQVSALAPAAALASVERALFLSSTTLGLRRRALERVVLARSFETVSTAYGSVRVKLGALDGQVLGAQPEFEDCRRLATRAGVPVRVVVGAALAAARPLLTAGAVPPVRPARGRARKGRGARKGS